MEGRIGKGHTTAYVPGVALQLLHLHPNETPEFKSRDINKKNKDKILDDTVQTKTTSIKSRIHTGRKTKIGFKTSV